MFKLYMLSAFITAFICAPLSSSFAESTVERGLRLEVQAKIVETAASRREGVPGNKNTKVSFQLVTLFPDVVGIKDKQSETIYDFKNKTLTYLDLVEKTYFTTSLYAVPAFNTLEKGNQLQMLASLKPEANHIPVEPFDLDMKFGGKFKAEDTAGLDGMRDKKGGKFVFRGEEIVSYRFGETAIPELLRKSYARYLTYQMTLHPQMKNALLDNGIAFESLHIFNHGIDPILAEKTYTVNAIKTVSEALPVIPADFRLAVPGKEGAVEILKLEAPASAAQANTDLMKKLYADKKYSELAIVYIGHVSAYGADMPEEQKSMLAGLIQEAPAESRVKEIIGLCSTQPNSPGNEKRITFLKAAQAFSPAYGYLLSGCLALYQQADGKMSDAQAARLSALIRNPALISVMKDLGDGYYRQYDTFTAWAFWNKARAINPSHPVLKGISELEKNISQDLPEYF